MKLRTLILIPLATMTAQAMANVQIYEASLDGLQEVPANASPATGFSRVTIDLNLITMRIESSFSGLIGNVSASHIHVGSGPGTNGGVATQLPTFVDFPLGVQSGTYDHTFDMADSSSYNPSFIAGNGGTVGSAFNAFVAALDAGRAYHNIHTTSFGGGEIRGDLKPVPEPASLIAMGAAVAGLVARRRRKA